MKAGLLSVAALAATAHAAVRRERPGHAHRHVHKRDVVTEVEVVTATAPNAIVYVDGSGKPVSTVYNGSPVAPTVQPEVKAPSTSVSKPTSSPAPSYGTPQPADAANPGYGISYAAYNGDSSCKTQDEINSDVQGMSGYQYIRVYGTDCNQVPMLINAANSMGMKLFLGIYDVNNAAAEAQIIIDAMGGNWGPVDTVSVGNEYVNNGGNPQDVLNALSTVRGMLNGAGYTGNIVTVDTFVALMNNPSLCQASDYAAANCHPFFDGNVDASGAGQFVSTQAGNVANACGKSVRITETGWPHQGDCNNVACPSPDNQATALNSIRSFFSDQLILFSAYDDAWKQDGPGTFNAEKYWGFLPQA